MGRIASKTTPQKLFSLKSGRYDRFDLVDGTHPWQEAVPEGYVLYPVRKLTGGKVIYFNFALAHEMGLIDQDHAHQMNPELEKKILETFNLRIVNEYDQQQNVRFHPSLLKKNKYMATRYLQLQHPDKRGLTSGDGRSIWNGVIEHKNTVWDISSRGTGVTCLAPGIVEAGRFLPSGNNQFGYACGLADIDELVGAAIMAEIFHRNNVPTERVLAIIDCGDGNGIGVRAAKNLLRPAHLFMFLKQGRLDPLRRGLDYLIDRQHKNREWKFSKNNPKKYKLLLNEISDSFAHFTAHLDRDYIFAWLDWDGDNVLANAGIIDYGSIRQFGLRHDEYRYDDVDRFSTNLNEQRIKARGIVQTFAQLCHFAETGKKKPLGAFKNHAAVRRFDEMFEHYLLDHFLYQLGFPRLLRARSLKTYGSLVRKVYASYSKLERVKTKRKAEKVADGVNRPAIFNMRTVLGVLPAYMRDSGHTKGLQCLPTETFFAHILADTASRRDRKITFAVRKQIDLFQKSYSELLWRTMSSTPAGSPRKFLETLADRAAQINRADRITGDALLYIVDELLNYKKKQRSFQLVQTAVDTIIADQTITVSDTSRETPSLEPDIGPSLQKLVSQMLSYIDGNKESI